jgi:hypothetical protein
VPVLDVIFGTAYLPERWPSAYGLAHEDPPPDGYVPQFFWPFRWRS